MNRILKFRAWSNGEMIYSGPMPQFGFWKWVGNTSDMVVMQFTGVLDKNGKEIFEGDIVETPMGRIPVTFEDGCFYTSLGGGRYRLGGWQKEIEVVGNIYESFDTLKS